MATNNAINEPTAATGKVLQGQGVGTTSAFSTATYPSTATGTGKILIADGTNWVASTPTYPSLAGTNGNLLTSDGTNWLSSPVSNVNTSKPCFLAYLSSNVGTTNGSGGVQVQYDTIVFDQNSNFTTGANAHFTAPVTGKYSFSCGVKLATGATIQVAILKMVSTSRELDVITSLTASAISSSCGVVNSFLVDMSSGDTFNVKIDSSTGGLNILGNGNPYDTFVSGFQIA